jgi:hypothetical protein
VYTFQICDNVHNVPAVCVPGSPTAGSPAPAPPASGSYPAYQWTNPAFTNASAAGAPPACYALGQPLAATGTLHNRPTLGLMDVNEPAAGVSVAYASIDAGTDCVDPTGAPRDRSFTLNLQCAYNAWTGAVQQPAGQPNIDGRHFITEVNNCEYQATSWTTAGCPLQCPVTGGALCAGAGICAFDKEALAARCFCDNDLAESDCTAPPNKCVRGPQRAGGRCPPRFSRALTLTRPSSFPQVPLGRRRGRLLRGRRAGRRRPPRRRLLPLAPERGRRRR